MQLAHEDLVGLVRIALREDLSETGDLTSTAILAAETSAVGRFVAREPLTLAGIPFAAQVYHLLDPALGFTAFRRDGDEVPAGECVAVVRGSARAILAGERTALNFLMRLSGIATATRCCVEEIEGTGALILDTRKTAPGLRAADKYAVAAGGGQNHRASLSDAVLWKDNHWQLLGDDNGELRDLIHQAPPGLPVCVEVENDEQLETALAAGVDWILADNQTAKTVAEWSRRAGPDVIIEASGGITPDNARPFAEAGARRISIGALTSAPQSISISFEITDAA